MKRREFITLLGGGAVAPAILWPLAAHAQQLIPVVGYLSSLSHDETSHLIAGFQKGLTEAGYVEGPSVSVEYRFADGRYDRLPAMAAELIRRPVAAIVATGPPAALAAKVATTTIPIVFVVGLDPVAAGLVATFNRPGGNATGITLITGPLGQKRLELLRELVPKASTIAMLHNPVSPDAAPEIRDVQAAAQANNLQLKMLNAGTPSEIDAAFTSVGQQRPDALIVGTDPVYVIRREEITALAARLQIPTIYPFREFVASGGLISYGTSLVGAYRQAGLYTGRILKGAKPKDMPVIQSEKLELIVNAQSARELGLTVPQSLMVEADDVLE
jgi:putative ABC transport system substrate-binding protein